MSLVCSPVSSYGVSSGQYQEMMCFTLCASCLEMTLVTCLFVLGSWCMVKTSENLFCRCTGSDTLFQVKDNKDGGAGNIV